MAKAKDKKKIYKLDPKTYLARLKKTSLKDVRLNMVNAHIKREFMKATTANIDINGSASYKVLENGEVEVLQEFHLKGRYAGTKGQFLTINCTYSLLFAAEIEFDDDFFEIFGDIQVPFLTWPYYRELVDSTAARFHIKPLVMPLQYRA